MSEPTVNKQIILRDLSKTYNLYGRQLDRLKECLHPFRKKYHQTFYALKNISLEVAPGEIVGVVGRNGSGKSTLLKVITGISTPTSGFVEVNGRISALLELSAGFNPDYTGMENIYLNGTIMGYSRKTIDEKLDEILSFADIGRFIDQPVKMYSSGMLVRLAFAVAVTVDPDILAVDEALAVGDALFQRKCYARIQRIIDNGKTVLFVSHNLDIVTQICQRAILMDAGELILEGKPKLVRNQYFNLLYGSPGDYGRTRREIEMLNADPERKKTMEGVPDAGFTGLPADESGETETAEEMESPGGFYQEGLVSQSAVHTRPHDVDMEDILLENMKGEKVNCLSVNEEYAFSCRVVFHEAAEKVTFCLGFRASTGFIISFSQAPGRYPFLCLERVEEGEEFRVTWRFHCHLLKGTYYTDVLVRGRVDGKERCLLNRIVDAYAFKVLDAPQSPFSGLVHLEQRAEIRKIPTGDKDREKR